MSTLFDTQKYIDTVKAGGVGDREAHAMSDALKGALGEGVATNEGLLRLEARIDVLAERVGGIDKKIDGVVFGLNGKIDGMGKGIEGKLDGAARATAGVAKGLNDKIDGLGKGLNDKIDGVAKGLNDKVEGAVSGLNDKIDGFGKGLNDKIDGVSHGLNDKIDGCERGLRAEMVAGFSVLKVWLMVLTALVALSNPLVMQFYKMVGLLH